MKIYLAHPITGLTYEQVNDYYSPTIDRLKGAGWDVLYPMLGKEYLRTEKGPLKPAGYNSGAFSTDHAIVQRDRWMVSQADVIYANLEGAKSVSIGTVSELAWASLLGKYVVLVLGKNNPHDHAFVLEAAGAILPDHETALAYLERLGGNP